MFLIFFQRIKHVGNFSDFPKFFLFFELHLILFLCFFLLFFIFHADIGLVIHDAVAALDPDSVRGRDEALNEEGEVLVKRQIGDPEEGDADRERSDDEDRRYPEYGRNSLIKQGGVGAVGEGKPHDTDDELRQGQESHDAVGLLDVLGDFELHGSDDLFSSLYQKIEVLSRSGVWSSGSDCCFVLSEYGCVVFWKYMKKQVVIVDDDVDDRFAETEMAEETLPGSKIMGIDPHRSPFFGKLSRIALNIFARIASQMGKVDTTFVILDGHWSNTSSRFEGIELAQILMEMVDMMRGRIKIEIALFSTDISKIPEETRELLVKLGIVCFQKGDNADLMRWLQKNSEPRASAIA